MINFHKYGFLDCRRLEQGKLMECNYWHHLFNPYWLFIWSDLYKPEIAYTNDFIYLRYLDREEGIVYFPPIGNGDYKLALFNLKQDAKENGIDFKMAPINSELYEKLDIYRYKMYENENLFDYIYTCDSLALANKKLYKNQIKGIKIFYENHPGCFFKVIKKEDFPRILEFVNQWYLNENKDIMDINIYARLNMINKCMEHLYELKLMGLIILDEEKIYGLAIGSVFNNMAYAHALLFNENDIGANFALISSFSRLCSSAARYINLESDYGNKEVRKRYLEYQPFKIERLYSTFSKN